MKAIKLLAATLYLIIFYYPIGYAQTEKQPPVFVTVTTNHFNFENDNGSRKEWNELEKEFFEKTILKNELILGHTTLVHYFTEDNSEILNVNIFKDWNSIEKGNENNDKLIEKAWPNENNRKNFFKKLDKYYLLFHSDEIYVDAQFTKNGELKNDRTYVYYVKKSHFSIYDEGTEKEFDTLYKEYLDEIILKNNFIIAYYTLVHAWGSDKTEFIEVMVVDDLGSIEKAFDKTGELEKSHWKKESDAEAFYKKLDKYFTGHHSDHIYQSVIGLRK